MLRLSAMIASFGTALALATSSPAGAASSMPGYATAAVTDASRPDADKKVDDDRKPAEMVVFAGIKPGSKVVDLIPGGGYFTRVFSKVAGAKGKVYAFVPDEFIKMRANAADPIKAIAADPGYSNVSVIVAPIGDFKVPEAVDVIWTSRNYHDMHDKFMGPVDMAAFDKAVFAALKPGGVFIVLDHAAASDAGADVTETLHRINPEQVKKEVLAAGFKLDGEDNALKNPADDHTSKVFDAGVRGKTDQFVLKFRKP